MSDQRRSIKFLISNSSSLPTLPGILTKISRLEAQKDSSTDDFARVINSDQILAAKVLRLVNSPFYGFSRRVSTISNALILLGVNVIKSLVLSSSIFEMMEKSFLGLWEHSLATAAAANVIATKLDLPDIEEISTAALLHDIGKVVIKIHLKDGYEQMLEDGSVQEFGAYEAEHQALGTEHAEVGQWLAENWYLPEKLLEPIACHHDVEKSQEHRTATAVVHYADALIKARGVGFSGDDFVPSIQIAAREELQIDEEQLTEIIAELEDRLVDVRNFSLDIQENEQEDTAQESSQ